MLYFSFFILSQNIFLQDDNMDFYFLGGGDYRDTVFSFFVAYGGGGREGDLSV